LRTTIDPREYVEIPSLLFLTLSYAFWLSFARVGTVSPTTWPLGETSYVRKIELLSKSSTLAWLVFAALFIFVPLRIYIRPSRWWFIRKAGRLLASGTCRVEAS
jgi:xenotropic and polytropic retrovirus receptor 1